VVETKFIGPKLSQREVANQLTIDKDYYRQHPDYQIHICFVYDPEYRCSNPAALERDIGVDEDNVRVRVIVSPKGT
jgi:DpnII restriction endonuclease